MASNSPQSALIEMNIKWLRQALGIVENITDRVYAHAPANLAPCRVSSHLRHILEFYECFLDGLAEGCIDYDARRRDPLLETGRSVAALRITALINRIGSLAVDAELPLFVRIEDASGLCIKDPFVMSSSARELMTLSSHTIHHFALIALTLRAHGETVDPDFGKAPSTIRYEQTKIREVA